MGLPPWVLAAGEVTGLHDLKAVLLQAKIAGLEAALALREDGTPPPGLDAPSFGLRPAAIIIPKEQQWSVAAQHLLVAEVHDE